MTPDFPCPDPGASPGRAAGNADRGLIRSAARWFTLPVSTVGLSCSARGRIYDAAWNSPYWYHFPSLNVNAGGDLLVGFSGSRATEYIGAFFQARKADGTWITRPGLVQAGRGPYTGGTRWGDYSATTVDPTNDPNNPGYGSFWTIQEYADPLHENPWGTWIMQLKSDQ